MRLKLQTKPPLPEVKAWFCPHPDNVPTTIAELKYSISRQIPSLEISGKDVLLLLDDFELLDDSPLDVVRDGDLILVKALSRDVDASGSETPVITSSHRIAQSQHFVPPGHGKSQTHSRNLRRRLKKKYDKAMLAQSADPASTPPKNCSAANTISLGPKTQSTEADSSLTPTQRDEFMQADSRDAETERPTGVTTMNVDGGRIMMSTLRNKNKRKGFKQSMSAPLPLKIVFDGGIAAKEPVSRSSQQPAQDVPGTEVTFSRPRLIPPSEKQERGELPPRMFVTSVDVEEGLWSNNQRKKKKKQKQREQVHEDYYYEDRSMQEEYVQLDYSEGAVGDNLDWGRAEKGWDEFVTITDIGQLAAGTIVGWKGLALNPLTASPEVMLSLASVVRLPEGDAEHQMIVIKQFSRPGGSNASFSHRLAEPEEGDEEMLEEEYTWDDILTLQWKIVKL
ncbi:hypothetical protein C0992_002850 [Termitomyces sp. T32_za158]|nr:hypothetical protein C0992_002850 [Termitomyces sp. T32_za158]